MSICQSGVVLRPAFAQVLTQCGLQNNRVRITSGISQLVCRISSDEEQIQFTKLKNKQNKRTNPLQVPRNAISPSSPTASLQVLKKSSASSWFLQSLLVLLCRGKYGTVAPGGLGSGLHVLLTLSQPPGRKLGR